MKVNIVKMIIAICLAMLLSLICYVLAPEVDNRKWISFGVSSLSLMVLLIQSMGIDYNCGNRNVNIKLVASIGVILTLISNIVFSCFTYSILIYIAIIGILTLLFVASIYSMYDPNIKEK